MKQALRTVFLTVQGPRFRFKLPRHTLPLGPGSFVTAFASSVLTLRKVGRLRAWVFFTKMIWVQDSLRPPLNSCVTLEGCYLGPQVPL